MDVGDIFSMLVPDALPDAYVCIDADVYQNGRTGINILKFAQTHVVSNIRHQHWCHRYLSKLDHYSPHVVQDVTDVNNETELVTCIRESWTYES